MALEEPPKCRSASLPLEISSAKIKDPEISKQASIIHFSICICTYLSNRRLDIFSVHIHGRHCVYSTWITLPGHRGCRVGGRLGGRSSLPVRCFLGNASLRSSHGLRGVGQTATMELCCVVVYISECELRTLTTTTTSPLRGTTMHKTTTSSNNSLSTTTSFASSFVVFWSSFLFAFVCFDDASWPHTLTHTSTRHSSVIASTTIVAPPRKDGDVRETLHASLYHSLAHSLTLSTSTLSLSLFLA